MIKFKECNKDLGVIKSNTNTDFIYEIEEGDINEIGSITVGCGSCTSILEKSNLGIKVRYKAGNYPHHLTKEGINEIEDTKRITIFYKDNTTEVLTFKLKKVK